MPAGTSRDSSAEERVSISRRLFSRQSITKKASQEASELPKPSRSPTFSRSRLAGFASRSLRKSQWRLFKHRTFFGSRGSTKAGSQQLQLPRLTLRHPSIDGSVMPLPLDAEDCPPATEFFKIRTTGYRRWTESESGTRLRDSRESSGFHDSHDLLDDVITSSMTAPVSPSVPLSASSSVSEGWKYSSQKLLWKLKPRYINFSHASSTSSSTDSAWKSLDSTTWRSVDGAEVILRGARLEALSESERSALQHLAQQRLSKLLPNVTLAKQKDPLANIKQKRQKLMKSSRTLTTGEVNRRPSGSSTDDERRVFGVSLSACVQHERRLESEGRCKSLDDSAVCLSVPAERRRNKFVKTPAKSVKSEPEIVKAMEERKWLYPFNQSTHSCAAPSPLVGSSNPSCSLPVQREHRSASTNHLAEPEREPLQKTESCTATLQHRFKKHRPTSASFSSSLDCAPDDTEVHELQVPRIVENCTEYLLKYGLSTIGLFRIAGSAKRCRTLRATLERSGCSIQGGISVNTTPHDIATLLKEYFRDLPQSLLPKEHYQAYITAAKLVGDERLECLRLLVSLLVSPNVDTLFVLLQFLHEVSQHCNDQLDEHGHVATQGNKMDARNLATIFAPSILRPDHDKLQATLAENELQISIVETMIRHADEIFNISKELQCKIFNKMRETEPDRLDRILNNMSRADGTEVPLLSPFPAMAEEEHSTETVVRDVRDSRDVELQPNGKEKVGSRRSGSWPFSLTRMSPKASQKQAFFQNDQDSIQYPSTSSCPSEEREERLSSEIRVVETIREKRNAESSRSAPSSGDPNSFRNVARHSAAAARRRLRNVVRAFRFSSVTRSTPNVAEL